MKLFGGNVLKQIDISGQAVHLFADDQYTYYLEGVAAGEALRPSLGSYCVFLLEDQGGNGAIISSGGTLWQGDALLVEKTPGLSISPSGGARFLVAGVRAARAGSMGVTRVPAAQLKKVIKPWGHELWINGEHPEFALKQIWLRRGHKTSLQYHRLKRETNVLLDGTARLHFKQNEAAKNDSVSPQDLFSTEFSAHAVLDVFPNTLHRLEAVTDLLLYEVSTPHLDDVVRVQDDANRGDGRIESEHRNSK